MKPAVVALGILAACLLGWALVIAAGFGIATGATALIGAF